MVFYSTKGWNISKFALIEPQLSVPKCGLIFDASTTARRCCSLYHTTTDASAMDAMDYE